MGNVTSYLELMRLTNPVGSIMVYLPHLDGVFFAVAMKDTSSNPSWLETLWLSAIFLPVSVILHASGCSWNDIVDAELDKQVERTKTRPIPRGAIALHDAYVFTLLETALWLALLRLISMKTVLWSLPLIPAVIAYPYLKRFTNFPSVLLGPIICWGALVGSASAGVDPMDRGFLYSIASLLAADSINMIMHDMVYSHQDLCDDLKAGILSMAVRFKDGPKLALFILAVVQLALRLLVDRLAGFSLVYTMSCICSISLNMWMIVDVDLTDAASCWWWFQAGGVMSGAAVTVGMLLQAFL